jgi:ubiquinone/menaquinone biosynthesis C-methylase UbiE
LDVGCGPGQYAACFSKAGYEVDLLDSSAAFLEIASDRLRANGVNSPRAFLCDILNITQRDTNSSIVYDAVWCSATLVHVPTIFYESVFGWFSSIIRDGGVLFINVQIDNPSVFAADGRYFNYIEDYTRIVNQLNKLGFENIDIVIKTIEQNTYGEYIGPYSWVNLYFVKRRTTSEFSDVAYASGFTASAYRRSFAQFVSLHVDSVGRKERVEEELDKVAKFCLKERLRLLDAGCGAGDVSISAARRGWKVAGVDIANEMISFARKKLQDSLLRSVDASFHVLDMRSMPTKWSGMFDAVVCITALQHIPRSTGQLDRVLKEFYRVLAVGGILRVDARIGEVSGFDPDGRYIQKLQSGEQLREILRDQKFEVLELKEETLPTGQNTFRRPLVLEFVSAWARKTAEV